MDFLEWFGYLSSLVILISLLNSSIIRLRWINLVGSLLFTVYGFLLGSIPVAILNGGIVIIDIYFLLKIYTSKEFFHILEFTSTSNYFNHFIDFYKDDIKDMFNGFDFRFTKDDVGIYILRNAVTAGLFIARKRDSGSLDIVLDYAVNEYRDFKMGKFLFDNNKEFFIDKGYTRLYSKVHNSTHEKYLLKVGFEKIKDSDDYVLGL